MKPIWASGRLFSDNRGVYFLPRFFNARHYFCDYWGWLLYGRLRGEEVYAPRTSGRAIPRVGVNYFARRNPGGYRRPFPNHPLQT